MNTTGDNNLIIDSGNTRTKIFMVQNTNVSNLLTVVHQNDAYIINFLKDIQFKHAIYCETGHERVHLKHWLQENAVRFINFNQNVPVPLINDYRTPDTLGYDRLATAAGADFLYAGQNILIIDTGTAITYDIVSNGSYKGGAIAPGLAMRFASLHEHTQKLPLIHYRTDYSIPGRNTEESILNGVVEGIKNEIEGTIRSYQRKYSKLITVLSGGDADIFARKIKNSIFAEPNLLVKGLNRILSYNVEKT